MRGLFKRGQWIAGALIGAMAFAGCGGGGSDNNTVTRTTPVKLDISWAARSRAVNAPSSALSAVVTLKGANADGSDFTFPINRDAAPAAYVKTYVSTLPATVGAHPLTVNFFAAADGAGANVGVASTTVTINADGSGIGDVVTAGVVASAELTANQSLVVGQTKDLAFAARDSSNNLVAVSPGSATFTVTSGGDKLQITGGQAAGVGVGTATATATVDGKTSVPQTIGVSSAVNRLEAVSSTTGLLYGTVRARVRGITDASAPITVTVGSVTSATAHVAYTDTKAPTDSSVNGGAVDFRVPYGLSSGSQNVVVTVGGVNLPAYVVNVSNVNPFAVFTLTNSGAAAGTFVAELRQDASPNTVANFVGLATGTKTYTDPGTGQQSNAPLYDGTYFHRAIAGFVRQGGDPLSKYVGKGVVGTGQIGFTIPFEVNSLTNNDGALAMARSTPLDSAASQFFVDDGPQHFLDTTKDSSGKPTGGYVVFGQVVENLPVAKAIKITYDANNTPVPGVIPTTLANVIITGKLDTP